MTPIMKIKAGIKLLLEGAREGGWGDPFASGRLREILLADFLGHELAKTLHEEDATDPKTGKKQEYKTTFNYRGFMGRYDISTQSNLKEQIEYINKEKIGCYDHVYATFNENYEIVGAFVAKGEDVAKRIIPKIEKKFGKTAGFKRKDLHATLTAKDIREIGKKIF